MRILLDTHEIGCTVFYFNDYLSALFVLIVDNIFLVDYTIYSHNAIIEDTSIYKIRFRE